MMYSQTDTNQIIKNREYQNKNHSVHTHNTYPQTFVLFSACSVQVQNFFSTLNSSSVLLNISHGNQIEFLKRSVILKWQMRWFKSGMSNPTLSIEEYGYVALSAANTFSLIQEEHFCSVSYKVSCLYSIMICSRTHLALKPKQHLHRCNSQDLKRPRGDEEQLHSGWSQGQTGDVLHVGEQPWGYIEL